jgi:hypothetical protein
MAINWRYQRLTWDVGHASASLCVAVPATYGGHDIGDGDITLLNTYQALILAPRGPMSLAMLDRQWFAAIMAMRR